MATSRGNSRDGIQFQFGDFKLSTEPYRLAFRGERVELAPQPAKALELLLDSAGDVVSREAIRRCLWDEDTFVDHVRGINFVVHQIRAALTDQASKPKYIETVPREGYRFVAPVSRDSPRITDPRSRPFATNPRAAALPRLALALIVLTAICWVLVQQSSQTRAVPRMAVVTASEVGSSPGHLSFVAEKLIVHLVEVLGPNLEVVAPPPGVQATKESVMADARYVLSLAFVEGPDDSSALVVRLSRCGDYTTLWTTSVSMDQQALPDALSSVAEGVAGNLGISLRSSLSRLPPAASDSLALSLDENYSLD